jgi:fructose-1-phosphate kinase PfkB-like protein
LGKNGALLQTREAAWLVQSPPILEKNPIGAGDALIGGLVYGLTRGLSVRESLAWGVASGAATASLSGTQVGSRDQIEALTAAVCFETVHSD